MNFTERHHAFLTAKYYEILRDGGFAEYRAVFRRATQHYAEQRGARMAQRALRDGRTLDFAAYVDYGEWAPTAQANAAVRTPMETWSENGDTYLRIHHCEWSEQYLAMGLEDGAEDYCAELDVSIARGFNPDLTYEVQHVMHKNRDYCLHCRRGACAPRGADEKPKNAVRPFAFHCAHALYAYGEIVTAVYGSRGALLAARVLEAFAMEYGFEMADVLVRMRDVNFNVAD